MSSSRSRASSAPSPNWLSNNHLLIGLLAAVILAILSEAAVLPAATSTVLLRVAALGLVVLLTTSGVYQEDLKTALRRGPHPFLIALLAWCVFAAAIAPYRAHAATELLRILLCAAVYFGAAYGLRGDQLRTAVGVLLLLGSATAVFPFIQFSTRTHDIMGMFGNHENFGSFVVVLLPVAIALAVQNDPAEEKMRLGAQVAVVVLGGALLLARTRSAWIGAAASLLTLTFLFLRFSGPRVKTRSKSHLVSPLLIVTLGFILLIIVGELAPLVSTRAASISRVMDDSSFADRLHRWRSAARMASERPITGWGLGAFPVIQGRWTHQGHDVERVLQEGTGHPNLAHNFWVQWAAETGAVGLALHVAVVAALVLSLLRALPTVASGFRKPLVMGCIATAIGGFVDGIGAPSYNYPGVSSLLWLWMGIGVAASRDVRKNIPALVTARPTTWWMAAAMGTAAALLVIGVGYKARLDGRSQPRGSFSVITVPPGSAQAGTQAVWIAVYQDPSGTPLPTTPGTSWKMTQGRLGSAESVIAVEEFTGVERSGWRGRLLRGSPSVTATATYWDNYSRRYDASATVMVEPGTANGSP